MTAPPPLLGHPLLALLVRVLRLLPAELSHAVGLRLLQLAAFVPMGLRVVRALCPPPPPDPVQLWGLRFVHRVGLAAGYDKDAVALQGLGAMGFSHLEVGTVTPLPQPGNPKPRVFRLLEHGALVNRMGFPSQGCAVVARRLAAYRARHPLGTAPLIGVNVGKNKDTPLERAADDYALAARALAPLADYLAINVSSPNTPQLRALQTPAYLIDILRRVDEAARLAAGRSVPILVKLAPDLQGPQLLALVEALSNSPAAGLILANTTLARPGAAGLAAQNLVGGLSGGPLGPIAAEVLQRAGSTAAGRLPLIASGGILSGQDALQRLGAGAVLVQLWTGLVVRGPGLLSEVGNTLAEAREQEDERTGNATAV